MFKVPIEVSARHVHLSQEDLKTLFGKRYVLKVLRYLSQKHYFAARETVTLKTEKNKIENVRVLGPIREWTQAEISGSDAYRLGINPPTQENSRHERGALITIQGPRGQVSRFAAIIAHRHIHLSKEEAKKYGLKAGELVSVRTKGQRAITFHNVLVRVHKDYNLAFHIDTDEANAASLKTGDKGELIK